MALIDGSRIRALGMTAILAMALTMPQVAAAQVSMAEHSTAISEGRATVGITIPFGTAGSDAERAPRLELAFDHRRLGHNGLAVLDTLNVRRPGPARLGFTLTRQPQLMLNGREAPELEKRNNMSTIGWVAVGLVAVAITGVLVINDALDCNLEDDGDCN